MPNLVTRRLLEHHYNNNNNNNFPSWKQFESMLNQTAQQPPQSQQRQQNQPPSPQSAFTNQQFQLLKSQLQAFKYFVRAPGQGQGQIPQNLIAYVSNPSSAMANDMYTSSEPASN